MDALDAITVLLADDHPTFRLGLRALLSQADGLEVVAEAGTGREALDRWQALRPSVVVLDCALLQGAVTRKSPTTCTLQSGLQCSTSETSSRRPAPPHGWKQLCGRKTGD